MVFHPIVYKGFFFWDTVWSAYTKHIYAMCLDIVSTRKRSRLGLVSDTRGSRLGLVSDSLANVSVSSRSRELRSRSWSRSRPRRSWAHPWQSTSNPAREPLGIFTSTYIGFGQLKKASHLRIDLVHIIFARKIALVNVALMHSVLASDSGQPYAGKWTKCVHINEGRRKIFYQKFSILQTKCNARLVEIDSSFGNGMWPKNISPPKLERNVALKFLWIDNCLM